MDYFLEVLSKIHNVTRMRINKNTSSFHSAVITVLLTLEWFEVRKEFIVLESGGPSPGRATLDYAEGAGKD